MKMSPGMKTNVKGELDNIKISLPEYYQNQLKLYGSYEQAILSVRKLLETIAADQGLSYNRDVPGILKTAVNWAAHAAGNTSHKHTKVTDKLQNRMLDVLWKWLKKRNLIVVESTIVDRFSSSDDEEEDDDDSSSEDSSSGSGSGSEDSEDSDDGADQLANQLSNAWR